MGEEDLPVPVEAPEEAVQVKLVADRAKRSASAPS